MFVKRLLGKSFLSLIYISKIIKMGIKFIVQQKNKLYQVFSFYSSCLIFLIIISMTQRHQLKPLEQLITEIKAKNDLNSVNITLCHENVSSVFKKIEDLQKLKDDEIRKQAKNWHAKNYTKLQEMPDYRGKRSDAFLIDLMVIIVYAVWVAFKKIPRAHQLICLWFNINSNKTILEVKTGQGKSMIVAMTALYFALRGKKVDVFTSSQTLAMTQTKPGSSTRKLFEIFQISVDDICRNIGCQSYKAYQSQVIYGTAFGFQADFLRNRFNGDLKYFKNRNFCKNHVAILDQVDALLIDRMRDSTRLSSPKPLFQCIKAVIILIHQVKKKLVKVKSQYSTIKLVKILGDEIKLDQRLNSNSSGQDDALSHEKSQINDIVLKGLRGDLQYIFPKYLLDGNESYIYKMVPLWIDSIYQIGHYKQDVHYTVDKVNKQIIPVDISTGTYQKNTKWMNGIHQFLQLKNGFMPSVDTIVTNYESNLIFFSRYEHYLYGLTGTIAESISKENKKKPEESVFEKFLKLTYKVNIFKIPTAKERLLKTQTPKVFGDKHEWKDGLYKDIKEYSQKRMVLIIFKTIKEAKQFIENLPQKQIYQITELYDQEKYLQSLEGKLDTRRRIIVSTNLGGRGTDIEIANKDILANGGLYVMMTYFADNWRIQEQALGRAGRNGQPGSGRFYINLNQDQLVGKGISENQQFCEEVFNKKSQHRKKCQIQNFQKAKVAIQNEGIKKKLLDQFYQRFLSNQQKRMRQIEQMTLNQEQKKIYYAKYYELNMECGLVEEQWGIFLKKNIPDKADKQEKLSIRFQSFVSDYQTNRILNNLNPGYFTICASQLFTIDPKRSQILYDQALDKNPNSWVSRYYKAYFKLKRYSNVDLSSSDASSIIEDLKQVCRIVVVQFALNAALNAQIASSKQQKQQIDELQTFYTQQMCYLQSIAQSLKKYVIDEKRRMQMTCRMKDNPCKSSVLATKGLNHIITGFQLQQIKQQEKEEKEENSSGFFGLIWSGIKAIVLTVYSAVKTVVAIVATPFVGIFGRKGDMERMWNDVGNTWKITGAQWVDVGKRVAKLGLIVAVGLFLLTTFLSGWFAIPAVAALIAWLYLPDGASIQTTASPVQIQRGYQQKKSLVYIQGIGQLSQHASKKLEEFRKQLQQKKIQTSKKYSIFYKQLKEQRTKVDSIKLKVLQRQAFASTVTDAAQAEKSSKKTDQSQKQKAKKREQQQALKAKKRQQQQAKKREQQQALKAKKRQQQQAKKREQQQALKAKKRQQQQAKKREQQQALKAKKRQQQQAKKREQQQVSKAKKMAIGKIWNARKIADNINAEKTLLHTKKIQTFQKIKTVTTKVVNDIANNVQVNIKQAQQALRQRIQLKKATNQDVQNYNSNLEKEQEALNKLGKTLSQTIQAKVEISKVSDASVSNISNEVKFSFISPQTISQHLKKVDEPLKEFANIVQEEKQVQVVFDFQKICQNPMAVDPSSVKNKIASDQLKGLQQDYLNVIEEKLANKERLVQSGLDQQYGKDSQAITLETLKNVTELAREAKITPLHNPNRINNYTHFEDIVRHKCLFANIPYEEVRQESRLADALKNQEKNPKIIIYNTAVIYRTDQKVLLKFYSKQLPQHQSVVKMMNNAGKKVEVIYANEQGMQSRGRSIVPDVEQFIRKKDINQKSNLFSNHDVQQEYLKALVIKATNILLLKKEYSHFAKARKQLQAKNERFLPHFMMPFEMGIQSPEFKSFGLKISDLICEEILTKQQDFKSNQHFVEKVRNEMMTLQTSIIRRGFPQFSKYVETQTIDNWCQI